MRGHASHRSLRNPLGRDYDYVRVSSASCCVRFVALPSARPLVARLSDGPVAYLVGGAVRDLLLGGAPIDLDLAVEGDAAVRSRVLGGELRVARPVRDLDRDARRRSRTTSRAPAARRTRTRARSPRWSPRRWRRTCNRRDFTVNAIALALAGDTAGELTWRRRRARRSRRAPAARSPRPQLHRRPDAPAPAGALRDSARVRDRAAHPRARGRRDRRAERSARSADRGSARSYDCSRASRIPSGALLGLRDLGLDTAIQPGFGLDDEDLARRALALLPADGRPDRLALAAAGRGVPGRRAGRAA